jgi:hypothetical protein
MADGVPDELQPNAPEAEAARPSPGPLSEGALGPRPDGPMPPLLVKRLSRYQDDRVKAVQAHRALYNRLHKSLDDEGGEYPYTPDAAPPEQKSMYDLVTEVCGNGNGHG